jgi:hypothetical protein
VRSRFFTQALRLGPAPVEVTTDEAGPYLRVLAELVPAAAHVTEQYTENRIEANHGQLKARLRPMRGLKRFRSAARIAAGHAFVQNLRTPRSTSAITARTASAHPTGANPAAKENPAATAQNTSPNAASTARRVSALRAGGAPARPAVGS